MGVWRDAVANGRPFLPTPADMAKIFWYWNPTTDAVADLDLPLSDAIDCYPWNVAPDRSSVSFRDEAAEAFHRMFGYVGRIEECKPIPNTETAYRFEAICKMPFFPNGHTPDMPASHMWVKIRAHGAIAMLARGEAFTLCDLAPGIPVANYGDTGRVNLDSVKLTTPTEWESLCPRNKPEQTEYDFREWVVEWLPVVSGQVWAVDEPGENRITGARLLPPKEDPRIYFREKREA